MALAPVDYVSEDQLQEERRRLLEQVGFSEESFLRQGDSWSLKTEAQWQAFERLKGIRFLLGEDD